MVQLYLKRLTKKEETEEEPVKTQKTKRGTEEKQN